MDSLSAAAQEKLANRLVRDDDPDRSDLEKAVAWVRAQGADEIVVVSWSGGRLDHTLAALALAFEDVALHDDRFRVTAVTGNAEFAAEPGTLFSLLALPRATVSVSGARWELARKTLAMGARDHPANVSATLDRIAAQARNELGRIDSLEAACHAADDAALMERAFAEAGLVQRDVEELAEPGRPPFGHFRILTR